MQHVKKRVWPYANSIKIKPGPQVRVITLISAFEAFWIQVLSLPGQFATRIRCVSLISRLIISTHYGGRINLIVVGR